MKKAIAMKCTQEDWDSIKDKLIERGTRINLVCDLFRHPYLTNTNGKEESINNINKDGFGYVWKRIEVTYETFNAKIFLEACGIEFEKKFEITKEQILKIAKKCTSHEYAMKEAFPEAFKNELIIRKWYKVKGFVCEYLLLYSGKNVSYGFSDKEWGNWSFSKGSNQEIAIEATTQEVEAALINEAKKIGFKDGISIKSTSGVIGLVNCGIFIYCNIYNKLYYGGYEIFDNGKWATIIETISKEEAEKLLNKKII